MRVTCDIDNHSSLVMFSLIGKGLYFFHKLPDKIRLTQRGFHIIYKHLDITEKESYKFRKIFKDDFNRRRLDSLESGKPKQILFDSKIATYFDGLHPAWVKMAGAESKEICKCGKKIISSRKIWTNDERCIRIYHKDSQCVIPLKNKHTISINILKMFGIDVSGK